MNEQHVDIDRLNEKGYAEEIAKHISQCPECIERVAEALVDIALNPKKKKLFGFTNEEYQATDRARTLLSEGDSMLLKDQAVSILHDHDNGGSLSVSICQTYQVVNGEGFSEKKPLQTTFVLPLETLDDFLNELIEVRYHMIEWNERNGN